MISTTYFSAPFAESSVLCRKWLLCGSLLSWSLSVLLSLLSSAEASWYETSDVKIEYSVSTSSEDKSMHREIAASSVDFRYFSEVAGLTCASAADKCVFNVQMQGLPSPSLQPSSTTLQGTDVEAADDSDDIPCFVAGHIDATHNWHGYIGIFRLRASLQAASRSSSDGMTPKTSSAAAAAEQTAGRSRRRPPRLYYRFVYPILDAERRCCSSMSAVLYSEDQFDRLRVRMNCVQRMAVVLNPTSTSATVSAAQQHQQLTKHQQIIALGTNAPPSSGCQNLTGSDSSSFVVCEGGRQFQSDAEQSWYVAISNCGSPTGITIDYALLVYGLAGSCPTGSGNQTKDYRMASISCRRFPGAATVISLAIILTLPLHRI